MAVHETEHRNAKPHMERQLNANSGRAPTQVVVFEITTVPLETARPTDVDSVGGGGGAV